MSTGLINRTQVKKYIKEQFNARRAHQISRVSDEAVDAVEAGTRHLIDRMISIHPSMGKTFHT